MTTIFNDGVLEAKLCPSRWIYVHWIQNKHGRLQKRLIKDLNGIEKHIYAAGLPGWFTASEITHKEFHKILEKFGARAREVEGNLQYFIKPILKEGDLHVRHG